jgi:hypothetical protein
LELSSAGKIILLEDLPIQWFLSYHDNRYSKLSQFGQDIANYGREHDVTINGKIYKAIPFCHPQHAGKLGISNTKEGLSKLINDDYPTYSAKILDYILNRNYKKVLNTEL